MMIEVLKAGLYTSVQDMGRMGFRNMGVPLSGAMDMLAAIKANQLVGNPANAALLEITLLGPTLRFTTSSQLVVTGAPFKLFLNASEIEINKVVSVAPNDEVTIKRAKSGMRGYVAIHGGIQTKKVLGSRSYYPGITASRVVKTGDFLPIVPFSKPLIDPAISEEKHPITALTVYKGPEFDKLSASQQKAFIAASFSVNSQSNRMAYLLDAIPNLSAAEIVTGPVQPGTVQLTPSGKVIVLMRDAQTTGGYARILQLTEEAISFLAQKRAGEVVQFTIIDSPFYTLS